MIIERRIHDGRNHYFGEQFQRRGPGIRQARSGRLLGNLVRPLPHAMLAARFGISSIPTLMVFENGQVKTSSVGVQSKSMIERMFA